MSLHGTGRTLVIVPAWNESAGLPAVTAELLRDAGDCDILVVDDGSDQPAAEFTAPGVVVLRLPFNLGIGNAMQAGYRYAADHEYAVAVQVDGDGQHPAAAVPALVAALADSGAAMAIGSRFAAPGLYRQSLARGAGALLLRGLLRLLTGRRYSDCTSGFRAVTRPLILAFAHWYPDDFPEPEVLLHVHRAGLGVVEVPVRMRQRTSGRSSITPGRGVLYVAKVSLALLLGVIRRPWPAELIRSTREFP